ncbi:hypothetical protein D3C86_1185580 [compost metagenome]
MASEACKNIDGVPVELSVATIFWAMMALFPIPVTINRPFDLKMISTASAKSLVRSSERFAIALLSANIVFLAEANIASFSIKTDFL